jgi:predicted membrane protein DUF2214
LPTLFFAPDSLRGCRQDSSEGIAHGVADRRCLDPLRVDHAVIFLRWRSDTRAGKGQKLVHEKFKRMQMIIRVEMTLLFLAPFFATWMAHGEL